MNSRRELKSYIRFQIEQLTAASGHHVFEEVCFHHAKKRICQNLLPATGPVSAGGDQGRDFETYRTHIQTVQSSSSFFTGQILSGHIAFACSLQKYRNNLANKIKSDVQKIIEHAPETAHIYFYAGDDVPVAKRHEIQNWCNDEFSIPLEILDANYLSDNLCESELFWIAVEHLNVASDQFPPPPTENPIDWYTDIHDRYKLRKNALMTTASFEEIRQATRFALSESDLHHDVPFWIEMLTEFTQGDCLEILKEKSGYEISVSQLKLKQNLFGREDELRRILDLENNTKSALPLRDTVTLWGFVFGAMSQNSVGLKIDEVYRWHASILRSLEEELRQTSETNARCDLLDHLGYINLFPTMEEVLSSSFETNRGVKRALRYWNQLKGLLENSPLYPLGSFIHNLNKIYALLPPSKILRNFLGEIETVLATRAGDARVAQLAVERAHQLQTANRLTDAINELHVSHANWLSYETLGESYSACLAIARAYGELGLYFAGRYYNLVAMQLCLTHDYPAGLAVPIGGLADTDFVLGNWLASWQESQASLMVASEYGGSHKHAAIGTGIALRTIWTLQLYLSMQLPKVSTEIQDKMRENWDLELDQRYTEDILDYWKSETPNRLVDQVNLKLVGKPFSDINKKRLASWTALGTKWSVIWHTDHVSVAKAEGFISSLQIVICETAGLDLLLLNSEVQMKLTAKESPGIECMYVGGNDIRQWLVGIPNSPTNSPHEINNQVISVCLEILSEISLLPEKRLATIWTEAFDNGLMAKSMSIGSYEDLMNASVDVSQENLVSPTEVESCDVGWAAVPSVVHENLAWKESLVDSYDEIQSHNAIQSRYEYSKNNMPVTLVRIGQSAETMSSVNELRKAGWKDWHILLAITNQLGNFLRESVHTSDANEPSTIKKYSSRKEFAKLLQNETRFEIPLAVFSSDSLEKHLNFSMVATLSHLDLEIRQVTPDMDAIQKFLAIRCRYWDDDVPHVDPFNPPPGLMI